jgi:hypothetical protein
MKIGSKEGGESRRSAPPALYRAVRLTARGSALLFAGSQAASALGPRAVRASRTLYVGFMAAHAVHFAVVSKYALVTGGRNLFPGGRSLAAVGGWPTVLAIFTGFAGLALTGRMGGGPQAPSRDVRRAAGRAASGVIGLMYVGTYLGQMSRSGWYALPAAIVGGSVLARLLSQPTKMQNG